MRRPLLLIMQLMLLLFTLPVSAGNGLLDARPSATLGASSASNDKDFLPVNQAFQLNVEPGDSGLIKLQFVIADGYYLYRHRFQFHAEPASVPLGAAQLPDGEKKHDEYFGDVEVYHNILEVSLPRPASAAGAFTLKVTYQGCADKGLCYPPETRTLAIDAVPGAAAAPTATAETAPIKAGWTWLELLGFFLAGIGLTFTPCVLPMLPIISGVVLRGKVSPLRGLSLSLSYVLAMTACFAAIGALVGLFGAQFNLQARLQSAWVLVPFAAFFSVFALAMFGTFELRLPAFINDRLNSVAGRTQGGSLLGAAALGVISSLVVSPCVSAPLAGALLYISASGDGVGGALKLCMLGLGMGAPLVLVATGGAAWLPRSGAWLVTVKNAIGVLLLGSAIGLLSRVVPGEVTLVLVGLLGAGTALFLGTLEFSVKTTRQRLAQLLGLFLLAYSLACWYGAFQGQTNPLAPLGQPSNATSPAGNATATGWQTVKTGAELDAALAAAKAAGKPLLLDWYADWCISCKVIEHQVLPDPQIAAQLSNFQLVRFDMTDSSAEQRALLDHFRLFGPPVLMFFGKQGNEQADLRIVGETDVSTLSSALREANDRI